MLVYHRVIINSWACQTHPLSTNSPTRRSRRRTATVAPPRARRFGSTCERTHWPRSMEPWRVFRKAENQMGISLVAVTSPSPSHHHEFLGGIKEKNVPGHGW